MTPASAIAQNEQSLAQQATPPRRVLVVDDDAEMRAYIRECLAGLPVRVEEAVDGPDALERIHAGRAEDVALVITDIVMPRMDGLALKDALRAAPPLAGIPVLLITGEAVRPRDGPVLRKPFNTRKLRAAVQALL